MKYNYMVYNHKTGKVWAYTECEDLGIQWTMMHKNLGLRKLSKKERKLARKLTEE